MEKPEILERVFPSNPDGLLPEETPDNQVYWDSLKQGELRVQRCEGCKRPRYPITPVCPSCGSRDFSWQRLSGNGRIFSWVRFDRSYLPQFEDLMPYVVATVELEEGVRMYARILDREVEPTIGMPVELAIERWPNGRCVAAFKIRSQS